MIVSFIVLFLGLELGLTSLEKIITPQPADFSALALGILVVSVAVKLWQCLFYRSVGKKIHSDTVYATSSDSRNDAIATSVVLLGAVITPADQPESGRIFRSGCGGVHCGFRREAGD